MGQLPRGTIDLIETNEDAKNYVHKKNGKLSYITQTTLSVDDTIEIIQILKNKFPDIREPKKDDICYATQNRQDALKQLSDKCDLILVVGSPNSSNSNRLKEIAEKRGTPAYLIDTADDIKEKWIVKKSNVGLTAGASAPEILVDEVTQRLKSLGAKILTDDQGLKENVFFVLPKALRNKK